MRVLTPSTGNSPHFCNQFDVSLVIPSARGGNIHVSPTLAIMEADFSRQGIVGLLGRDVLESAIFSYNGFAANFTLSF